MQPIPSTSSSDVIESITLNQLVHSWDKVKEAQGDAIKHNVKLMQATFDFGNELIRAEHQMGSFVLMQELAERGIEEATARSVMAITKANPGGVAEVASSPKRLEKVLEGLLFPANEVQQQRGDGGRAAFAVTFRLNVDPRDMKPDTLGELRRKVEPVLRLALDLGWVKPVA
jgi:hypothetical protein